MNRLYVSDRNIDPPRGLHTPCPGPTITGAQLALTPAVQAALSCVMPSFDESGGPACMSQRCLEQQLHDAHALRPPQSRTPIFGQMSGVPMAPAWA